MKPLIKALSASLTLLMAAAALPAHAQMSDRLAERPTASRYDGETAVAVTREMMNRLHLNEGQYLKLLPLNRTKLAGLNSINHLYRNDEVVRAAKAAELQSQFEQECSRILTPSQLSQLQQDTSRPNAAPAGTGNGVG